MHPVNAESIARLVHLARAERVLLDFHLAELYGVTTKALNQAVRRNRARFPEDFMFQLTAAEWESIRTQFVTASRRRSDALPLAFTESRSATTSSSPRCSTPSSA
jgi:hypothetical protein